MPRWSHPGSWRARLPAGNRVLCALSDPTVPGLAAQPRDDPFGGGARPLATPSGRRDRRHRQRPDSAVPPAGTARRRSAPPGGHPGLPRRLRRSRRVQSRTGVQPARHPLHHRARTARRQRHGVGRRQRSGDRSPRMTSPCWSLAVHRRHRRGRAGRRIRSRPPPDRHRRPAGRRRAPPRPDPRRWPRTPALALALQRRYSTNS